MGLPYVATCSNVYLGPSLRDPRPPDEHGVDFFGGSTSGIRQELQGPAGISSNKYEPGFHCRRLLTSSTSTNEKRGPLAPLEIYRRVGEYGTVSCEDIYNIVTLPYLSMGFSSPTFPFGNTGVFLMVPSSCWLKGKPKGTPHVVDHIPLLRQIHTSFSQN